MVSADSGGLVLTDTTLEGVKIVRRTRRSDHRGYLDRLFESAESSFGGNFEVRQANVVVTTRSGTVRGLHMQTPPHSEMKLVTCVQGAIFDISVDLRPGSATSGSWFGTTLSAENGDSLLIPAGCAHGLQTLTGETVVVYLHTSAYVPESEIVVNPLSSRIGIAWPMPIVGMSARDAAAPDYWSGGA